MWGSDYVPLRPIKTGDNNMSIQEQAKQELVDTLAAYNSGSIDKDDPLKKELDKMVRRTKVGTGIRWGTTALAVTGTAMGTTALIWNYKQGKRLNALEEALFGDEQQVSNGVHKSKSAAARA